MLYLFFGYWMASNNQLLANSHLSPMQSQRDVFETGHTYSSVMSNQGWEGFEWPLLLCAIFLMVVYFFGYYLEVCIAKCFPSISIGDIDLNEEIDNYWAALDEGDRKWSIEEEKHSRLQLLTSEILTNEQFERLKSVPMTTGKTLQGTHSYDILANPLYFDDFQYITAAEPDRAEIIIDNDKDEENDAAQSDLVRVALNLAYLTETEARNFKFTPTGLRGCNAAPTKGYQSVNEMI